MSKTRKPQRLEKKVTAERTYRQSENRQRESYNQSISGEKKKGLAAPKPAKYLKPVEETKTYKKAYGTGLEREPKAKSRHAKPLTKMQSKKAK
jgi:hypothetical protein